ncbi:CHC2 zinc finger domain-containing protein (plasmid) [Aneurinibacillus sp. Ricciae_BoGa-3]|uniref:CHC2 zinc finger domain-containing protein n=1 Tax=Aneurinibacillus sp. Ricciae_BoGa-3 TaxID=3022697 RepID=UPI0023421CF4|nr:CHC2 zinc finger domain-containing protein [Aneurinibacillus sp. Ricciae_BoGa-3]WCK56963.1 CHC2 zinc finger domain-containing protein [Aneurinibacillus sp. Ricciae_BoGa-3]
MDKRQFAEEVIESVRSLSLVSVISTRINLPRQRGVNIKALCPFHNDRSIGSFVVTEKKGIWKCFSCGAGGDAIKFVAEFDSINYLQSAFKLALEFGIISNWEYEEYFERRRYSREQILKIERRYEEIDKKRFENNIADEHTLDEVFRLFIEQAPLSDEHREHLLTERNLTPDEIEEGLYFTFPTRHILKEFSKAIKERYNGSEEILTRIPGFYYEKESQRFTFTKHKGIGIGIKNGNGKVVGIQIRHDKNDENKNRYVWFSSSFASNDEKYEHGTSSGAPIDVVYPKEIKNNTVFITEGRFKAQKIATEKGSIAISVQGVASWRGIMKELKRIPSSPILQQCLPQTKQFAIQAIFVAFDADMNYKVQVFTQAKQMTDCLEDNEEQKFPVYYLNWDDSLGKGIDDILNSEQQTAIKRYDKQIWDKSYENMIEDILDKEDYLEIKDVPEEVIRKYFHMHMNIAPLGKNEYSEKHKKLKALQR